jgi:hypothetical protein
MARTRPVIVTVVSIILIVLTSIGLLGVLAILPTSEGQAAVTASGTPLWVTLAMALVGAAVTLAAAIAMLRGLSWGRSIYLLYVPLAQVLSWILYGFYITSLVSLTVYIVFLILLTRPSVNAYFART